MSRKKKTHAQFIQELHLVNPNIEVLGTYAGVKEKIECKCKICSHLWKAQAGNLLCGKGCPKCGIKNRGNNKKSNKEEFIEKARLKHGNKYDYSKFVYTRAIDKSIIICPIHGEFLQDPHGHLSGNGCPKCNGGVKYNTEDFIEAARNKHGDKYDYSKVEYIRNTIPVIIQCPIHGEFKMTPQNHLAGCGCAQCGIEAARESMTDTAEQFIQKARKVHKNNYSYYKVNYINQKTPIIITCPIHGDFEQLPYNHLRGEGCPKCGREKANQSESLSREEWVLRAREKHGYRYDYSKVEYVNSRTKVCIICPEHGEFWQTAGSHLQGIGCSKCSQSKGEKEIRKYLVKNNIDYISQYKIKIDTNINKSGNAFIDFFLPNYNIAIEYNGQQHYIPIESFGGELKFNQQQRRDEYVKNYCKETGIELIEIPYTIPFAKIEQFLIEKLNSSHEQ